MNETPDRSLGWKPCFAQQLSIAEADQLLAVRVGGHLGSQVVCLGGGQERLLPSTLLQACGDLAVGDWLLLDPDTHRGIRRLERESLVARKAAGEKVRSQLIAANLDSLFIVSSCNHNFNLSRLERYLALAAEAHVNPVVVLTKADLCDESDAMRQQATRLKSGLIVEAVDARNRQQLDSLADWCGLGQTVALVGSSGVGKSTLAMSLGAREIETQPIREDDSMGRHTTTTRSMYRLNQGGLLIDTPGMRELQLAGCDEGVAEVFAEIVTLANQCRFRDCRHEHEPGCAVRQAIETGLLDARRLHSYHKLQAEQARNRKALHERHYESRKQGQLYKTIQASKRRR